jgi:Pyridoxamine 5'-phosphate oxidase
VSRLGAAGGWGADRDKFRFMASWAAFEAEVPAFAARVRTRLEAHRHKTIATLRKDGSPRISGIECEVEDGELRFGAMWRSVKALDLLRDPRFALHSGSDDPPTWNGDAKLAGTAHAAAREGAELGRYHLFTADITEAVLVGLDEARERLVVESWHEGRGLARVER